MKRIATVTAVAFAALVLAAAAGAEQTYPDASGDAGAGTDLRSATVANDLAGTITISITVGNPLLDNHVIILFIDSDKNAATGAPGIGAEYEMFAFPTAGGRILQWNGSTFAVVSPASFRLNASGNVQQFIINRADLGNTAGFAFGIVSASVDGNNFNVWDVMPESDFYVYDLSFPQCSNGRDDDGDGKIDTPDLGCSSPTDDNEADDPVHVRLGAARTVPLHPKAGGRAVVSAPAVRIETNLALDSGSVRCTARIVGGAALRGAGSLVAGRAQCVFRIPATARGRIVRGVIIITYQTASASRPFSFSTART